MQRVVLTNGIEWRLYHLSFSENEGIVHNIAFTVNIIDEIDRRELNRNAPARLEIQDVFAAVRDALSKEALLEAGDIGITKRRKRRRKITRTDAAGQTVTEEIEEDEPVATVTAAAVQAEIQPTNQTAVQAPNQLTSKL